MVSIKIIGVGKIKEKYFTAGIDEYVKRLSRYCKIEITEVNDQKIPEKASRNEEEMVRKKEGEQILAHVREGDYVIALCIEGKQLDSVELAQTVEKLGVTGKSSICFIIGGSLGLSDEVKKLAQLKLSFSRFTFPHQLMRLILVEQIYRAFKIQNNEIYHK